MLILLSCAERMWDALAQASQGCHIQSSLLHQQLLHRDWHMSVNDMQAMCMVLFSFQQLAWKGDGAARAACIVLPYSLFAQARSAVEPPRSCRDAKHTFAARCNIPTGPWPC